MKRICYRFNVDGEVMEYDLIICRARRWAATPESLDASWGTARIGSLIFALRPGSHNGPKSLDDSNLRSGLTRF